MVAAQGPITPTGAATAYIIVSAICWALSAVAIGLRICSRAFNKGHSIWGWDDTLAVGGMVRTESKQLPISAKPDPTLC